MAELIPIADLSAPELDPYARKTENQLLNREHPEEGLFIAESPKVILRALDAGCTPISALIDAKETGGEASEVLSRLGGTPVYAADETVLSSLTGFRLTRGLLCAMRRPPLHSAEEVCADAKRIAVLENIMNPTNIGAVFRSAAALNMDAVLLTPACCDPLYRRAVRVSMGTVFQFPWAWLGEIGTDYPGTDMGRLKAMGFRTVSMALRPDSLSLRDPRLAAEKRLAVIMGTENTGLHQETIARSDYTVMIPMTHGVDSLNVAAASAVAFWQLGCPADQIGNIR